MKRITLLLVILLFTVTTFAATDAELIQQAKTKNAAGQTEEAIRILDTLAITSPGNHQAKYALADICVAAGEKEYSARNFKNAFELYKKAVKASPTHPLATERYWAMKNDFDVNNLKNEGAAIQAQPQIQAQSQPLIQPQPQTVQPQTTVQAVKETQPIEEKPVPQPKVVIQKPKETKSAEKEYFNKIAQMEARFNRRILEMAAQNQKLAQLTQLKVKEETWYSSLFKNKALFIAAIFAAVLAFFAIGFLINMLVKYLKKMQKIRKGKSEYNGLFESDEAPANYNELIKMQNIKDILNRIKCGELDWTNIKKSISEMEKELRIEVLNLIESKLDRERQPLTAGQADLMMCLITDGDEYLRKRVNLVLTGQVGSGLIAGQLALPYKKESKKTNKKKPKKNS